MKFCRLFQKAAAVLWLRLRHCLFCLRQRHLLWATLAQLGFPTLMTGMET